MDNSTREYNYCVFLIKSAVQAEVSSNAYVVSGINSIKRIEELLPGILPQMDFENLQHIKNLASRLNESLAANAKDEIPQLVNESFEDIAKNDETSAMELTGLTCFYINKSKQKYNNKKKISKYHLIWKNV
ncbi:beta-NAC-like protein, partial [Reticulomyxa filosa]